MCQIWSNLTIRYQNDAALVSLLLTLNSFHIFFWGFHVWLWTSTCWPSTTWAGIFSQGRLAINYSLEIFAKKLHRRYSAGFWIRLRFKVTLNRKIKCIRLFCTCIFQMNFFYFASWNTYFDFSSFYQLFIGCSLASFPYKPLVFLLSLNEHYGGLEKNTENVKKK